MSFESESEKNTQVNTTQIHRNKRGTELPAEGCASRSASTRSAGTVHGTVPAKNTQPKNHHGSWRSAMGVKIAREMLADEKKLQKVVEPVCRKPVPGHGDRQEQRHPPLEVQLAPGRISRVQRL